MKKKHLINVALVIVGLIGMLKAPPTPTAAQSSFDCATVTEIPQAECQALVALYNATTGDWWKNRTGWLQTATPCSWYGVTCDAGHVSQLVLRQNDLSGPIPPEIGDFSFLTTLDLCCNVEMEPGLAQIAPAPRQPSRNNESPGLRGAVPAEIGKLVNLTSLDLSVNPITSLPNEIGNLANLTTLRLQGNPLTSLPPGIGNLSNLTNLELHRTDLTSLPPEFGNLDNLTRLVLAANYKLTTLPATFGDLSALKDLNLSMNYLSSLPPEFGNLPNLTTLNMSFSYNLSSLPPEFGNLPNLTTLDMSFNYNLSSLPSEFGNLPGLTTLKLSYAPKLNSIPAGFGNLPQLTTLDLSNNALTTLPPEFGNLPNLIALDLTFNDLTTLPAGFGNLGSLTHLDLYKNKLTSLPPEFGNLASLKHLNLNTNSLTTLPQEFSHLAALAYLDLSFNDLTALPSEFGNLTHLITLSLGVNNLTTLPAGFSNLTSLTNLTLSANHLTDLPSDFGDIPNLTGLSLYNNGLTDLPEELYNLSTLKHLSLSNNALTSLPPEFGNLVNLTNLNLYNNALTALPPEFGKLTKLVYLDLSNEELDPYPNHNALTSLPPEFGNLASLAFLNLDGNRLTTLAPEFGKLTNLTNLGLEDNALTSLPPELGALPKLSWLDLSGNPLRGAIPDFIAQLTALTNFYFENTEWCVPLAGPVPAWLDNLGWPSTSGTACVPLATLNLDPAPEVNAHVASPFIAAAAPVTTYYPISFTWNAGSASPIQHITNYAVTDTAWLTWDAPGTYTVTVAAANVLGVVAATQAVIVHPISSTIVLPDAPAQLAYTDTQGLPTTLDLPAGSVTQTAHLLYRSQPATTPPAFWRPTGHSFVFDLYREGRALSQPLPAPATLTLKYSEADVAGIDRPADLQLMRQDSNGWQPAACGPVSRDLEQHVLSLPVCQLGQFALFAPATLTKLVEPTTIIANGSLLTYTLVFSNPDGGTLRLFDPISPTLAWQRFGGTPPAGIAFANGALSGTLTLSPAHPLTISFTVRAQLPETAFTGGQAAVANTAYFCPTDTACILHPSNTVASTVRGATRIFLPLVQVQLKGSEAIQACDDTGWCKYFANNELQKALDLANLSPTRAMTLTLQPGVYATDSYLTGIKQKDWMVDCLSISYGTSFLLKNRTAPTLIQGASGNPADVIILGGPTSWYANTPKANIAHALTLENDSGPVTLAHLTLLSHGGRSDRGLGGDALNVLNATGVLTHSIVAGNRTSANPLYQDWLHASTPMTLSLVQEGVYLYGPATNFDIVNSLIAGNFHTGVMAAENAQGRIIASLVRDNGWNDWDPSQNALKGHGITTLGGPYFAGCYLENSQLKVWNNLILHNNGNGVFLRGSLDTITTGVTHNTIARNANHGLWVDGLSLSNNGSLFIANNLVLTNTAAGVAFGDQLAGPVGSIQLYHNNSSHNLGANYSPPGYSGIVGITTRQNNIELSNPLLDAIYRPLPGSQLIGAGWAMSDDPNANPTPDISSYSYILYPQYVFQPATADLWCQLYDALGKVGAPAYPAPCP